MAGGESKTEKATPKKRRDERKQGHVFISKDAVAVATLLGTYFILRILAGTYTEQLQLFMDFSFSTAGVLSVGELVGHLSELTSQAALVLLKTVGPLAGASVLCAMAATFAQTKFLVAPAVLRPKLSKLSPLKGFKRLFSLKSVIEALKGLLKISVLVVIIYLCLVDMYQGLSKFLYTDVAFSCAYLFDSAADMVLKIIVAFVFLAGLDFLYQWWDYERQLKMSKQEIKEEYKQMEGDPKIKAKIREIQRRMARSRMMQKVPGADVVIKNPTHFAVALRYKPDEDNAPIVLAKGKDELALRIVQVAEQNQVAVVENVALARALYADTELDREIPPALYAAVAEVMVYIFRLDANKQIVK